MLRLAKTICRLVMDRSIHWSQIKVVIGFHQRQDRILPIAVNATASIGGGEHPLSLPEVNQVLKSYGAQTLVVTDLASQFETEMSADLPAAPLPRCMTVKKRLRKYIMQLERVIDAGSLANILEGFVSELQAIRHNK